MNSLIIYVSFILTTFSSNSAELLDPAKNFVVTVKTSIPWIEDFSDLSSRESLILDLNIRSEIYQQIYGSRVLTGKLKNVELLELYPTESADGANKTSILLRLDFKQPIKLAAIRDLFTRITNSAQFRRVKTSYIRLLKIQNPQDVQSSSSPTGSSTLNTTFGGGNLTTTVANHTNWFNYTAPALNASLTISNETKVDNGSGLHSTVFNNGTAINSTVFQNSTTINFTTVANLTANINLTDTINVTTLRQNFADVTESPVYPQTFQLWPIYLTEQPTTTVENEVEVLSTLVYFTRRHSRRTTGSSTPTTTTSPTIATTATPTVLNITSKSTAVLTPNVTSSNSSDQLVPNSQNLVETNVIVNNPDVRLNDSSYTDSATLLALEAQILAVNQQTNLSDFQPSPTVYSDSLVEPEDFVERYVTLPPPYDFVKH